MLVTVFNYNVFNKIPVVEKQPFNLGESGLFDVFRTEINIYE